MVYAELLLKTNYVIKIKIRKGRPVKVSPFKSPEEIRYKYSTNSGHFCQYLFIEIIVDVKDSCSVFL